MEAGKEGEKGGLSRVEGGGGGGYWRKKLGENWMKESREENEIMKGGRVIEKGKKIMEGSGKRKIWQ